ncbi:MAG TPA: xanthine dehydrogenase family protein subunit M [Bryobacteraceae bacterium]|jgi:aerobic carbon-monoxide dehydrogenase medium subunit|nr:xanthine dehydrogenase family protein subunit M [Bryobacteraceae bacterium]
MIPQTFEYTAPKTLDEAVALAGSGAKLLAGGMSLIPMMKLRLAAPEHLVDLGRIKDLNYIREEGGALHIGATATHYSVESSALVRTKCPLLAETASAIGDVQVRNMGTMGGSVAHADPSADYPAALQALEGKVVIRGAKGERTVSAADFFVDSFATTLEPGEIIREIVVPVEEAGTGTSYQKNVQPASGFAIVGVAARIKRSSGKITLARIGVTGLSNVGYRATAAEKALEGTPGSAEDVAKAAGLVSQGADANSDLHASSDYRKHLATVYAARAINAALAATAKT